MGGIGARAQKAAEEQKEGEGERGGFCYSGRCRRWRVRGMGMPWLL
jgi:hypothetical protein